MLAAAVFAFESELLIKGRLIKQVFMGWFVYRFLTVAGFADSRFFKRVILLGPRVKAATAHGFGDAALSPTRWAIPFHAATAKG